MNSLDLSNLGFGNDERRYGALFMLQILEIIFNGEDVDIQNTIRIYKYKYPERLYKVYMLMASDFKYNVQYLLDDAYKYGEKKLLEYVGRKYGITQSKEKYVYKKSYKYNTRGYVRIDHENNNHAINLVREECERKVKNVIQLLEIELKEAMGIQFNEYKKKYEEEKALINEAWKKEQEKKEAERLRKAEEENERNRQAELQRIERQRIERKEYEAREKREWEERDKRRKEIEIREAKEREEWHEKLLKNLTIGDCNICYDENVKVYNTCGCSLKKCLGCIEKLNYICCVCDRSM